MPGEARAASDRRRRRGGKKGEPARAARRVPDIKGAIGSEKRRERVHGKKDREMEQGGCFPRRLRRKRAPHCRGCGKGNIVTATPERKKKEKRAGGSTTGGDMADCHPSPHQFYEGHAFVVGDGNVDSCVKKSRRTRGSAERV